MPWRGPSHPGELPTLGWYAIDWIERYLVVPDGRLGGQPMRLTREQAQFLLNFYALDLAGRRRVQRAVLSRAKGWGKSPFLAALCLLEAFGDVVPDGWDENGEPVGRPWTSLGFKALVQVVAVSEDQTANTWGPLLDMARTSDELLGDYAYDVNETFIALDRGRVDYRTASATSAEGYRPVFSPCDQTESWTPTNGGVKLAAAIRRNLAKTGGASIESPNSYRPADRATMSVAQRTHDAYRLQAAGRTRGSEGRILWDHREAPASTVLSDRDSLMAGLAYAYGCSAIPLDPQRGCALHGRDCEPGWVDLERIADEVWDPATDPAEARQYFLGQITGAEDAWVTAAEWEARRVDESRRLIPGDTVTLGFDGSRRRKKGVTDATALVVVRVTDGHAELLRAWEEPTPCPDDWEIPEAEVDAEVSDAFARYTVVGFYADPARWESWVATWEARYGRRLRVKATAQKPITWWLNEGRKTLVKRAVASTRQAILTGPLTHRAQTTLTEHVTNARTEDGWLRKETPDSAKKIDASWALVLAWQARLDAVAGRAVRKAYKPIPHRR